MADIVVQAWERMVEVLGVLRLAIQKACRFSHPWTNGDDMTTMITTDKQEIDAAVERIMRLIYRADELSDEELRVFIRAELESRVPRGVQWRHKKRGTVYETAGQALAQASTAPINDGDTVQVYRSQDGALYARKVEEFQDGRFERVAAAPEQPTQEGAE